MRIYTNYRAETRTRLQAAFAAHRDPPPSPAHITAALDIVRKIDASGATIIFVERNMRMVLNQGWIVAQGAPEELRQSREINAAYLGHAA